MKRIFEDSGSLGSLDLLAALLAVASRRSGGTVECEHGGVSVRMSFSDGDLVGLTPPGDLSPGEVLIRGGKIARETYDALAVSDGEDRFEVAVKSGVVSRRESAWARKMSAVETLSRLLSWTGGSYRYDPDGSLDGQEGFRLAVRRWILELFLRSRDRPLVLRNLGPTDLALETVSGFASRFRDLGLTADADAVVERIDGRRSAAEISHGAPSDEFAVLKLLAALTTLGLVRPVFEAEPAEPAEPAPLFDREQDGRDALSARSPEEPAQFPEESEPFPPPAEIASEAPQPQEPEGDQPFPPGDASAPEPAIELPVPIPLAAITSPETDRERQDEMLAMGEVDALDGPPRARGPRLAILVVAAVVAIGGLVAYFATRNALPAASSAPALPRLAPIPAAPQPPGTEGIAASSAGPSQQRAAPSPSASTRAASRAASRFDALAKRGATAFASPGRRPWAIQLEIACRDETVEKALEPEAGGREVWIAPFSFRGRSCYRVLWGRYESAGAAKKGLARVPGVFRQGGNRPAVVRLSREKLGAP